jgi:hypothetical protein
MYVGKLPESDNNYFKISCLAMVHRCHQANYNEKIKVVLPMKALFGWKLLWENTKIFNTGPLMFRTKHHASKL